MLVKPKELELSNSSVSRPGPGDRGIPVYTGKIPVCISEYWYSVIPISMPLLRYSVVSVLRYFVIPTGITVIP